MFAPGLANVDLSIVKGWYFDEQGRLEFRWEIFNLLNRANLDVPNRIFGTNSSEAQRLQDFFQSRRPNS